MIKNRFIILKKAMAQKFALTALPYKDLPKIKN